MDAGDLDLAGNGILGFAATECADREDNGILGVAHSADALLQSGNDLTSDRDGINTVVRFCTMRRLAVDADHKATGGRGDAARATADAANEIGALMKCEDGIDFRVIHHAAFDHFFCVPATFFVRLEKELDSAI